MNNNNNNKILTIGQNLPNSFFFIYLKNFTILGKICQIVFLVYKIKKIIIIFLKN